MTRGVDDDPWVEARTRTPLPRALVWSLWGGLGCSLLALASLLVIFVWVGSSPTPGPNAEAEDEIAPRVLADMRADGLLEPDERVLYLYSSALFHVRDDAVFFTDRRVVSIPGALEERAGERLSARYDEIAELAFEPAEGALDESAVRVVLHDGRELVLKVGCGAGGDVRFEQALRREWQARGGARTDPGASPREPR